MAFCLFCGIVSGEIPANLVAENGSGIAFRDISPQAPSHVLVVPRRHVASLAAAEDARELGELLLLAADVARKEGISEDGFRLVANTGENGGQTVNHLHFHVLGGRAMTWPPG